MSLDNLETDEEEEADKDVFLQEEAAQESSTAEKDRQRLLLLLENGDNRTHGGDLDYDEDVFMRDEEDDDDVVDVEVDSRLGDSSDDDDHREQDISEAVGVRTSIHDSDSYGGAVSRSGSPGEVEMSPGSPWISHQNSHQSPDSQFHSVLSARDQISREEDEGGGEEQHQSEAVTSGAGDVISPEAGLLSPSYLSEDDDQVERVVLEVTEEMVDRIADEQWDQVNGTYDADGQWRQWDETTSQINPYSDEMFHILPYVQTGW